MANYKFSNLNSNVSIKNPKIKIGNISYNEGVANVDVSLSVSNAPQGQAPNFGVTFTGMSYAGDEPTKAEIDTWVADELKKYIDNGV